MYALDPSLSGAHAFVRAAAMEAYLEWLKSLIDDGILESNTNPELTHDNNVTTDKINDYCAGCSVPELPQPSYSQIIGSNKITDSQKIGSNIILRWQR